MNALLKHVKKHIKESSQKEKQDAARQNKLNNFENLTVKDSDDKLERQMAALGEDAWKAGPNKRAKFNKDITTKKTSYRTLDECVNDYYFSISA